MYLLEYLENIILNYFSHIFIFIVGFGYSWFRTNFYFIKVTLRKIRSIFKRKRYIIVWNDDILIHSEKICRELKKELGDKYIYQVIDEPRDLLFYPVGRKYVALIAFFVTDVTKFSEKPKERDLIQYKLLSHLKKEGIMVGTHDIIYRRCRNDALQSLFGGQLNDFKRVNTPIEIEVLNDFYDHPLVYGLDKEFCLDDGEVCWGEWVPDVNIIAQTKKGFDGRKKVPILVTRNVSYDGLVIWMNSGDKFIGAPNSISKPENNMISILSNAIRFEREIKDFNKKP